MMKVPGVFIAFWGFVTLPAFGAPASSLLDIVDVQTATPEAVQQALKSTPDPNATDDIGRSALMLAAAANPDAAVVTVLIKAGARVNARGPHGWTALMMAAYSNPNPQIVVSLLKAGADPKLRSQAGNTALVYGQDNSSLKGSQAWRMLQAVTLK
jgi:ankyrin repeat protein